MRMLVAALVASLVLCPAASAEPSGAKSRRATAGGAKPQPAAENGPPDIRSSAAIVVEQGATRVLYAKNADAVLPIASITKLMTAVVVLDSGEPFEEPVAITAEDLDEIKHTRSRLKIGTVLTRGELLHVALMASENRAASALARSHPGGTRAFVAAMNARARALGMTRTRFVDGTGLSSSNVSTAHDLARLVLAAHGYPVIREYTTSPGHAVTLEDGRLLQYNNSNRLVMNAGWDIGLSKTGYISEAGRCLVMQSRIAARDVVIVLLESWGRNTRIGDANRIRKWMESRLPRG
ncbi:MAG: D-alanyl-D-alanine endopeptidase [Burkholderiales bacterium]|nr:D-alanyl-D-alanine endopeptidase [Burkholderiales bacterium]